MRKKFIGTLFLVVGNSGSGKDSIISGVINKYPLKLKRVYVPERYITRLPSETEKNVYVAPEKFKEMDRSGKFTLKWNIYGLDYGVPIEIDIWLEKGHPVVVNVSRLIVKEARRKYENLKVVFIKVPFDISIKRLKERGREEGEFFNERVERARKNQIFPEADYIIDNSGDINNAINQFINYIASILKKKR